MTAIIDSRDRWPFPSITEHRGTWHEVSEKFADDMHNALPPIPVMGGFYVGEPAAHAADGTVVHTLVASVGGRWFAADVRLTRADAARALATLHELTRRQEART